MENPNFGPGDLCFRDFSKPWYNDRAECLCINAIESLIGEPITKFTFKKGSPDPSARCVEIGKKYNVALRYFGDSGYACIELQKLIDALESQAVFSHSQLEDRYNLLLREHQNG